MSTKKIRRMFVYPASSAVAKLPGLGLRRGDVLLASSSKQQEELEKKVTSGVKVWLAPELPGRGRGQQVAKHICNKLLHYRRFRGVRFELVVVDGNCEYVDALAQELAELNPKREDEGSHVTFMLPPLAAEELLGESEVMQALRQRVDELANDTCPVLIVGPTGSGKELVAAQLHEHSEREGEFTALNGAMLTAELAESKLFGHTAGAFTDAKKRKGGRIEEAEEGTFFLDELFHVPAAVQPKLLRAIAEAHRGVIHVQALGATTERTLEVRLVTAAQRHPLLMGDRSLVRDDLYYRVAGEVLEVPPLVDRLDDLELLAQHFAGDEVEIAPEAIDVLRQHPWPGNVRELKLVIERARRRSSCGPITAEAVRASLDPTPRAAGCEIELPCDLERELAAIELGARERALERYGTQAEAARRLQVNVKDWKRKIDYLRKQVNQDE